MESFFDDWARAGFTTLGIFWMALWAFGLGYLISSSIQVFVTEQRMKQTMGEAGPKSVALGAFFGFISSSCSFAALSTTRSLFTKGAGIIPALSFLLASTNLVIELGIVISVFLGWQFVVGEYVGAVLLILLMWLIVSWTLSDDLEQSAREHASAQEESDESDGDPPDWKSLLLSTDGWRQVAERYFMEWRMVWKDVTVGFTVAGIIAVFVPRSFFESLFVGAGSSDPSFWEVLAQSLVGPVAAFFTFIGSMGNIPLAAVLFANGVSFAGVMAFIFSDLVVFPVLRIQAKYYGWKMALYILGVFLVILVVSAMVMHYAFAAFGVLPEGASGASVVDRDFFEWNYTTFLNIAFIGLSVGFFAWKGLASGFEASGDDRLSERVLFWLSWVALAWLALGLLLKFAFGFG